MKTTGKLSAPIAGWGQRLRGGLLPLAGSVKRMGLVTNIHKRKKSNPGLRNVEIMS